MDRSTDESLWNGENGAGGISWIERSRMGPLRGVIDAADMLGRRNTYMHTLHLRVLRHELERVASRSAALDFGCGTGRFIETLAQYFKAVWATDKEPAMIEAARSYAADHAAEIVRCDPVKTPFADAQFDFVLCSSVLCVTPTRIVEAVVRELARVTRPGGTLLFLEQVAEERALPAARYYQALRGAGCIVRRSYPIRSGRSAFTNFIAENTYVPPSFFDALAALELFITRRWPLHRRSRYIEYAIVACFPGAPSSRC